jgi:hypothetical protein
MPAALYDIPDPRDRAAEYRQSAINTYGMQTPNIKPPGKTVGGGIQNAMGGAMAGGVLGTTISGAATAGPIGAAGGAILGAAAYFLS